MAAPLPPGVKPYDPVPTEEQPDPNFVPNDARTKEPPATERQRATARARQERMLRQYERAHISSRHNRVPPGYLQKLFEASASKVRAQQADDAAWEAAHRDDEG